MSHGEIKNGNVVVLGVKGSGKTVFLSVLGHTFEEAGVFGLNLTGQLGTQTSDYVRNAYGTMFLENKWPEATIEGTRAELAWSVRDGMEDLFTIRSIDCAGEEIVKALVPTAADEAERRRNREANRGKDSAAGAEWDTENPATDDEPNDTIELIAKRVAEASIVCIFVNPADFESYIYGKGDLFGSGDEQKRAIDRSKDMWRLLQTFLERPRTDGKKIIVTVTQAGRDEFAGLLGENGSARALLLGMAGNLNNWKGFSEAHVIAVSAVDSICWKTPEPEEKRLEPIPENLDKAQKLIWRGRKDAADHSAPREFPEISREHPPIGLVEFLLAVGGPLCDELRPLDEALRSLRKSHYALFSAKKIEASAKERLRAANDLEKAWKVYDSQAKTYLAKPSRRGAVKATALHLAEEEAKVIGLIAAEVELDLLLRNAASSGEIPAYDEAMKQVAENVNKRVAAATQERPEVTDRYRQILPEDILVKPRWLDVQFKTYKIEREQSLSAFDEAVSRFHAVAAQDAFDNFSEYAPQREVETMRERLAELFALIEERNRRSQQLGEIADTLAEINQTNSEGKPPACGADIGEAFRNKILALCAEQLFMKARDMVEVARKTVANARGILDSLDGRRAKFDDGADIDANRERVDNLESACDWAESHIGECEAAARTEAERRTRLLKKVRIAIAAALALSLLAAWLNGRSAMASQMRTKWEKSLADAQAGRYGQAAERIETIQDHAVFLLWRDSFIDYDMARRIALGVQFAVARDTAESLLKDIDNRKQKFTSEPKVLGKEEKLAPQEWREFLDARSAASLKKPRISPDKYGLPPTPEETEQAIAAYQETGKAAEKADVAFGKFRDAANKTLAEIDRKMRIRELKSYLASSAPPQGWKAIAEALPSKGVLPWLDSLADDALSKKWRDVLSAGLAPGTPIPTIDGSKAKAAFDEIRSKATDSEWTESFAPVEKDCETVLNAAADVEKELLRRKTLRNELLEAGAAADTRSWDEADKHLEAANACLATVRAIDASSRKAAAGIEKKVKDGRAADKLAAAEEKALKTLDEINGFILAGQLREAAIRFQSLGSPPAKAAQRIPGVRSTLENALKASIGEAVGKGSVESVDFQPGTRFCFDVETFSKVTEDALVLAIDTLCPASPKSNFAPDWTAIERISNAMHGTEFGSQKYTTVSDRANSWISAWTNEARAEAEMANSACNGKKQDIKAAFAHLVKAEKALARIRETKESGKVGEIQEKLPSIIRVSLVDSKGKALDAASLISRPRTNYASVPSDQGKGVNDIVMASIDGNDTVLFVFGKKDKNSGRPSLGFDKKHGIRHVRLTLGSADIVDL